MSLLIDAIALKHGLKKSFVERYWRESKKEMSERGEKKNYSGCVELLKEKLGLSTGQALPMKNESAILDGFKLEILESNSNVTLCSVSSCPKEFSKYIKENSTLLVRSSDLTETTSSGSVGCMPVQTMGPTKKINKKKKKGDIGALYAVDSTNEDFDAELDAYLGLSPLKESEGFTCGFCSVSPCNCQSIVESTTQEVEFDNNLTPKELSSVYSSLGVSDEDHAGEIDAGDKIELEEPPKILTQDDEAPKAFSGGAGPSLDVSDELDVSDGPSDAESEFDSEEEEPEEEVSLDTDVEEDDNRESIQYANESEKKKSRMLMIHETMFGNEPAKKIKTTISKTESMSGIKPVSRGNAGKKAENTANFFSQF